MSVAVLVSVMLAFIHKKPLNWYLKYTVLHFYINLESNWQIITTKNIWLIPINCRKNVRLISYFFILYNFLQKKLCVEQDQDMTWTTRFKLTCSLMNTMMYSLIYKKKSM